MTFSIKGTIAKIKEKSADIEKEKILAHNKECFKLHFDDGCGEVFVYPHECRGKTSKGKNIGYIYEGLYQGPDLLGVRVYESSNVEVNEFKNLHPIKNKSGKELFSLDELTEFDYEHTNKIWKEETFKSSPQANNLKAARGVIKEMINTKRVNG